MHIHIYSLKKTLFDGEVSSVNCPTASGYITILDNHRPLISLMREGTMTIQDAGGATHEFPIKDGFLEVQEGNVARFIVEQ